MLLKAFVSSQLYMAPTDHKDVTFSERQPVQHWKKIQEISALQLKIQYKNTVYLRNKHVNRSQRGCYAGRSLWVPGSGAFSGNGESGHSECINNPSVRFLDSKSVLFPQVETEGHPGVPGSWKGLVSWFWEAVWMSLSSECIGFGK